MNKANQLLNQATSELDAAREELNRPDEDVVVFSVCYQTRTAMADMLVAYLELNGVDSTKAKTLEELREISASINEHFKHLDLKKMACHPGHLVGEKCYCLDPGRVKNCLDIADKCKNIIYGM